MYVAMCGLSLSGSRRLALSERMRNGYWWTWEQPRGGGFGGRCPGIGTAHSSAFCERRMVVVAEK